MRPPRFWRHGAGRTLPFLLSPLAALTTRLTAWRVSRPGWQAPVPVICCGNVTVGGAGKTILALDLGHRLKTLGMDIHFLTRGHGGKTRGVLRVTQAHDAKTVGDEPLLLAALAPTWVGANRAATARAAIDAGARILVMDDGLQNPSLEKDLSLLVIDGQTGFGNNRTLPAGPLREPVAAGADRCQGAVLIGADATGATRQLGDLPILRAWLTPGPQTKALAGKRVLAFAGIGLPQKFFATLTDAGAQLIETRTFPDHHPFTPADLKDLLQTAKTQNAIPVTTTKDAARLAPADRAKITTADVTLAWQEPDLIDSWLKTLARPRLLIGAPQEK